MNERHVRRMSKLGTVVVLLALLLPTLFGEAREKDGTGGDAWRNVIQDFQTLFAGILAVGAAYATIWQMQKTDARSDLRHQELMRLNVRADALEIERALFPAYPRLQNARTEFQRYYEMIELWYGGDGMDLVELNESLKDILRSAEGVQQELAVFQRPSTAKLIGGHLTARIQMTMGIVAEAQSIAAAAGVHVTNERDATEAYADEPKAMARAVLKGRIEARQKSVRETHAMIGHVVSFTGPVITQLEELRDLYELEI